jgi:hypothetical protein
VPAVEAKGPAEGDARADDPCWKPLFARQLAVVMVEHYPEWSGLAATPTQADIDEARVRAAKDLRALWWAARG